MFKRKGGGVKGLLNNVQKNCTFLKGWLQQETLIKTNLLLQGWSLEVFKMKRIGA